MALSLVWADFTADQLQFILNPPKTFMTQVGNLAEVLHLDKQLDNPQVLIEMDLYKSVLAFSIEQGHSPEQMSASFSIVKAVHKKATGERLVVDEAMKHFKELMLTHSVHRPPHSIGLFSDDASRALTAWILNGYFRHYKLYQYAFTAAVTMSVSTSHPSDQVELPPPMQPLKAAATEEEHMATVAKEEEAAAAEAAAAEAAAKDEAEKKREAAIREEYEAAIPNEIKYQVETALARELELLKTKMEEQFSVQETNLMARIDELNEKTAT